MSFGSPATYRLGPDAGQLTVTTGTAGPAARAGHDLTIVARSWEATLTLAQRLEDDALELSVDPASLVVVAGRGGASPLSEEDQAGISATIRQEILGQSPIRFQSTQVSRGDRGERLTVAGHLELAGARRPLSFDVLCVDGGRLTAGLALLQSEYGIKPYTVLFGALKVADEVKISIDVALPEASRSPEA